MKKSSIWNKLSGSAINASMLSVVLLLFGCAAGRESRTAIRLDSLSRTETEETTYESVPMTQTSLPLPPDHLQMVGKLPQGFGTSIKQNGIGLKVESDGEGGLVITAETEDLRKTVTTKKILETSVSNLMEEEKTKEAKPSLWQKIKVATGISVTIMLIIGLWWLKNRFKNN